MGFLELPFYLFLYKTFMLLTYAVHAGDLMVKQCKVELLKEFKF